jgi:anti-sigma B factor antagonist
MSRTLSLQIHQRRMGPVVILDLYGEIAVGSGGTALCDSICYLLEEGRKKLLLNLAGVTFVDSFGVAELVRAHEMSERVCGELKIVNLDERVRSLLQVTKLTAVFEDFEGERDAVVSFARAKIHAA